MYLAGVEEPLGPNEQLYALDESASETVLAAFSQSDLNRYAFLPGEGGEWSREDLSSDLVRHLVAEQAAHWVFVWSCELTGNERIRNLGRISRLRKAGWEVQEDSGLGIARRRYSPTTCRGFGDEAIPADYGECILVIGGGDDGSMLKSPAVTSLRHMATTWALSPSPEMVSWLAKSRAAVAYVAKDYRDRPGVVLLSPERLGLSELDKMLGGLSRVNPPSDIWRSEP